MSLSSSHILRGNIVSPLFRTGTFHQVKEYIQTNNATAYDVATHFHLPLSRIKEWIDDGMIEYKDIPGHKL